MFLTDEMYYLNKAANALKCAVTSGFVNMWYLIGSVYYTLNFIGQDALLSGNIWAYYPTICSCLIEVDGYVTMLSGFAANLFSFGGSDEESADNCTDYNGNQLYTTDESGNSVNMDSDNSGLTACPCYDDTNTEYTCMADLDTDSCFESVETDDASASSDEVTCSTEYWSCTDDALGSMSGTADADFISTDSGCSDFVALGGEGA